MLMAAAVQGIAGQPLRRRRLHGYGHGWQRRDRPDACRVILSGEVVFQGGCRSRPCCCCCAVGMPDHMGRRVSQRLQSWVSALWQRCWRPSAGAAARARLRAHLCSRAIPTRLPSAPCLTSQPSARGAGQHLRPPSPSQPTPALQAEPWCAWSFSLPGACVRALQRRPRLPTPSPPPPPDTRPTRSHAGPPSDPLSPAMATPADLEAIPGLVQRLRSGRSVAQLQAARALSNLARTGSAARRAIAEAGAMPILMRLASSESGPMALQQDAADALTQVINEEQGLTETFVAAGGGPLLVRLLVHGGSEQLQLAGAKLAIGVMQRNYSWCSDAQTALAEAGGIPILVQLMGSEPSDAAVAALKKCGGRPARVRVRHSCSRRGASARAAAAVRPTCSASFCCGSNRQDGKWRPGMLRSTCGSWSRPAACAAAVR